MVFTPENDQSVEEETLSPPKFFIKRQVKKDVSPLGAKDSSPPGKKIITSHSKNHSQQKLKEYRVLTKD